MSTTHEIIDVFLKGLLGQYEEKTGLKGIGGIAHGLVGGVAKEYLPNQPVPESVMNIGATVFDWFQSGRLAATPSVQQPVQQTAPTQPVVGVPVAGATAEGRERTGRMR